MAKERKSKKKVCPLVDNITDFSDMEYEDDSNINDFKNHKKHNNNYDDYDDSNLWDYNSYDNEDSEDDEENLWEDNTEEEQLNNDDSLMFEKNKSKTINYNQKKIEFYMDAAFWFNNISEKGIPDKEELRYVELMIIELSKFYFANLDKISPSEKCMESINSIFDNIQEAKNKCIDSCKE